MSMGMGNAFENLDGMFSVLEAKNTSGYETVDWLCLLSYESMGTSVCVIHPTQSKGCGEIQTLCCGGTCHGGT